MDVFKRFWDRDGQFFDGMKEECQAFGIKILFSAYLIGS